MLTKVADVGFGKERTKRQKINNGIMEKNSWINFKLLEKHIYSRIFFSFSKIFHAKSLVFFLTGVFFF